MRRGCVCLAVGRDDGRSAEREGEDASVAQARELVDWIEGRAEHRGKAENGMAAVEIIMAIYESARMHEAVTMPVQDTGIAAGGDDRRGGDCRWSVLGGMIFGRFCCGGRRWMVKAVASRNSG